ncbi:MAG: glycosyltransferase family 4 protein [Bacteroidia bacterium]
MQIGFDAKRLFNNKTGLGNYSRQLIQNIQLAGKQNTYFLFTPKRKLHINFYSNVVCIEPKAKLWKILSGLWRLIMPAFICKYNKIKIFHGLSNELPFFLKLNCIKGIVTIHDLIFLRYPEYYNSFDRLIYKLKTKHACKNADIIVAISQQTKNDICSFYKINPQKIAVIPLSYDAIFSQSIPQNEIQSIQNKYKLNNPFFLSVGTVEPRKNQHRLIEAFELSGIKDTELIIIGNIKSEYAKKLMKLVQQKALMVRFLKVSSNEELASIYRLCKAFFYISEFEGFGIPPLEAMASGVPVIVSNTSSLPEVCGDAGYYVNPTDVLDIKNAFVNINNKDDLRKSLVYKGNERLKNFDMKLIANKYLELYNSIVD